MKQSPFILNSILLFQYYWFSTSIQVLTFSGYSYILVLRISLSTFSNEVSIQMTRYFFSIFFLVLLTKAYSQSDPINNRKIYSTSLKINFSGLRIGIEQKVLQRTTIQLQRFYMGKTNAKIN